MSTIVITIDTDLGTARINRKPTSNAQPALPAVTYPRRGKSERKQINHRKPIASPVAFVRNWLDEHPDLARKDAIFQLIDLGVNKSTARTQYHKWVKSTVTE